MSQGQDTARIRAAAATGISPFISPSFCSQACAAPTILSLSQASRSGKRKAEDEAEKPAAKRPDAAASKAKGKAPAAKAATPSGKAPKKAPAKKAAAKVTRAAGCLTAGGVQRGHVAAFLHSTQLLAAVPPLPPLPNTRPYALARVQATPAKKAAAKKTDKKAAPAVKKVGGCSAGRARRAALEQDAALEGSCGRQACAPPCHLTVLLAFSAPQTTATKKAAAPKKAATKPQAKASPKKQPRAAAKPAAKKAAAAGSKAKPAARSSRAKK